MTKLNESTKITLKEIDNYIFEGYYSNDTGCVRFVCEIKNKTTNDIKKTYCLVYHKKLTFVSKDIFIDNQLIAGLNVSEKVEYQIKIAEKKFRRAIENEKLKLQHKNFVSWETEKTGYSKSDGETYRHTLKFDKVTLVFDEHYVLDFGKCINPAYELEKGITGGLNFGGTWKTFNKEKGWNAVRALTEEEKIALEILE